MTHVPLHETLRQSAITGAVLRVLHLNWPHPLDLAPSTLDPAAVGEDGLFVQSIRALVDEGLIAIEALLIGAGDEPVARGALLTHKGAAMLDQVTRPM
ncbi:hypothetical protein [Sphingomonas sp.]|uniref:hypothetical protein n=1 Tax=Sphingomonas sp. TaxID=28214 RepID=UPI0035C7AC72